MTIISLVNPWRGRVRRFAFTKELPAGLYGLEFGLFANVEQDFLRKLPAKARGLLEALGTMPAVERLQFGRYHITIDISEAFLMERVLAEIVEELVEYLEWHEPFEVAFEGFSDGVDEIDLKKAHVIEYSREHERCYYKPASANQAPASTDV